MTIICLFAAWRADYRLPGRSAGQASESTAKRPYAALSSHTRHANDHHITYLRPDMVNAACPEGLWGER